MFKKTVICTSMLFTLLSLSANPVNAGQYPVLSVAESLDFNSLEVVEGASVLLREKRAVSMTYHATGLQPGAVYTAWWVIFNKPENCTDGVCDGDDVEVDPISPQTALLWASGLIIGADGTGNFSAQLGKRDLPGESLIGSGLRKVKRAEIHIVVRNHGLPITGMVGEQLTTFAGGCDINVCLDEQAAVHPPL